ncbi:hypothetical protein ACHAW5_009034 [Stephanodiscus triporus]|uniref:SPX domain-containing protein n=1 Tax=Stephanodiscus triporus TaxID=2934178 RepID=A0ABD3QK48_9STRA
MVEFGLQLEDNKVDEWSSQYIDYERLRGLLHRASASAELRDEIIRRMPTDAVAEVAQGRGNIMSVGTIPPALVEKNPDGPSRISKARKYSFDVSDADESDSVSTPLFTKTSNRRGINQTMLHVTTYLGLSDDREVLLNAYDDLDDKMRSFEQAYEQELTKVRGFYQEKSHEISQRIDGLLESVDASSVRPEKKNHHRRSSSLEGWIVKKFGPMIHGNRLRTVRERSSIPTIEAVFGESFDDDASKEHDRVKKTDSIKRAITDVYRTAKLLHNFSILNYTGFSEIAKKWDRKFPEHKGAFRGKNCDDEKQTQLLATKLERMYSTWFCEGDVLAAQAEMLPKRGDGLLMDWTQLRLGYRLGMCSVIALWVAWDCIWGVVHKGEVSIAGRTAFPVFRGCFGLVAWHWFWGMSAYVWTRYRVNYIYLFEFDPRNVDTPIDIFNDAVDETLILLICTLLYYKADVWSRKCWEEIQLNETPDIACERHLWTSPNAYPTFLILYAIKCLLFPWKRRKTLWIAIKHVIIAPFISPTFFLTYVGDVFTSMVKVFQDLLWTLCFFGSGDFLLSVADHEKGGVHAWTEQFWYTNVAIPLICLFPLWLRLNQCLRKYLDTGNRMPHLANAFKYAMSQTVTLFGAFHPLYLMQSGHAHTDGQGGAIVVESYHYKSTLFQYFWFGLFISSSLYSFCWDVYMGESTNGTKECNQCISCIRHHTIIDWGLGRRDCGYLGPRLMFPKQSCYYCVICADLVLRFMWVLTLVPPQSGAQFILPNYLSAIQMILELFRRTIWGFFRLEHEHRQNTEGFRRVTVVPLHFNTGHTHNYNKRDFVGWKVLVEISIVTTVVVAISAYSVIVAQRATHRVQYNDSDL